MSARSVKTIAWGAYGVAFPTAMHEMARIGKPPPERTRIKILAIASGGGHWVQLRRIQEAFTDGEVVFASVTADYAEEVPGHRFYCVRDVTRWDRLGILVLAVQLLGVLYRERPNVVVTTGSAPGFIALCMAKKLLRARTMWIDSIANCEQMSSSGLRARRFADAWLTQWPYLEGKDGPKYWGAVL